MSWLPPLSGAGHPHRVASCFLVQQEESQDYTLSGNWEHRRQQPGNRQRWKESSIPPQHTHSHCAYVNATAFTTDGKIIAGIYYKAAIPQRRSKPQTSKHPPQVAEGKPFVALLRHFCDIMSIQNHREHVGSSNAETPFEQNHRSDLSCTRSHIVRFPGRFWSGHCLFPQSAPGQITKTSDPNSRNQGPCQGLRFQETLSANFSTTVPPFGPLVSFRYSTIYGEATTAASSLLEDVF